MIAIDAAHCDLLYGLIRAQKPESVLELGFGEGASCLAMRRALLENGTPTARYVLVDDWTDWGGLPFAAATDLRGVTLIEQSEETFVLSCQERFDFILSDADHQRTERWFERTYSDLLAPGGILCYHDVNNPDFPNLRTLVDTCRENGLRYVVFDRSSSPGERCERGLLVIFKPGEDA